MPYQGPWSECNHCNNNMLATHEHNASALFWYTQRYHDPRTEEHGSPAGAVSEELSCRLGSRRLASPDDKTQPLSLLQNISPEVIRLAVMMYVQVPHCRCGMWRILLHERGIDICHETVRFWWNRFGPVFAAEIRRRAGGPYAFGDSHWQWHLDEVFVKINGEHALPLAGGRS